MYINNLGINFIFFEITFGIYKNNVYICIIKTKEN